MKTLREIREKKRISIGETGIDSGLLSRIETGKREMTMRVAKHLSKLYGKTLDQIVASDDLVR